MTSDPAAAVRRAEQVLMVLRVDLPALLERRLPGVEIAVQNSPSPDPLRSGEHRLCLQINGDLGVEVTVGKLTQVPAKQTAPDPWEEDLSACRHCGVVTPFAALNPEGACPECAAEQWAAMSPAERTAWCKTYKAHFPYQDKGPLPPAELERIQALLESHPFRVAKTMPKNPHEYTLRHEWHDVGVAVFEEVVRAIREHGETEWFGTYPWRILKFGGYKYWTYFTSAVEEVIVLNRKPLPPTFQPTNNDD